MVNFTIHTDGSCRANGNGGIGIVILRDGDKVAEYSRGYAKVTNNKMELVAIFLALKTIKKEIDNLEIISDSQYAIGVLTKPWNPKKNVSLILAIKEQIKETQKLVKNSIVWTHTRGHADDKWNNRADWLAQNASENI